MHLYKALSFLAAAAAAAAAAPALVTGAPLQAREENQMVHGPLGHDSNDITDGVGRGNDQYILYQGDGSETDGWPGQNLWVSLEDMFNANKPNMLTSCASAWNVPNDTGPEVGAIWNAIQRIAATTRVDHRLILAVIMQESLGCVRVHTTNYGVTNPGLMQDHDGAYSCDVNDNAKGGSGGGGGGLKTPCPATDIDGMIQDGTGGTKSGDGLAGILDRLGSTGSASDGGGGGLTDVSAYYKAARIYNSGSLPQSGRLEGRPGAMLCYASDIANRLTGWVDAPTTCHLGLGS